MKKVKGLVCSVLTLLMAASVFIGCTKTDETTNSKATDGTSGESKVEAPGWIGEQKQKYYVGKDTSFNWYLNYSWWPHNKEWKEYPVLNEITQITGVEPKVSIPSGDGAEKLNLMMSTGDLPDLITLDFTDKNVEKLISQGLVYSYDELIEKYCPEFKNEIPEDIYRYYKSDIDGKLYGLPSWYTAGKPNNSTAFNVRSDIYEQLGKPDMSTPESFKNTLKLFQEKYPTMEGRKSIPLTLGVEAGEIYVLEPSFGIKNYYVQNDGTLKHRYKDPKYIELIKYVNGLYRDGLLDQESFVKKDDQITEDLSTRVFVAPRSWWGLWDAEAALKTKYPNAAYNVISPMAKEGVKYEIGQSRLGWTISLITKKAKDPESVLKFTRYMWSKEGNLLLHYGHEGEDYTMEGNTIVRSDAFTNEYNKDATATSEKTGIYTYRFFAYPYWDNALTGGFKELPERAANRKLANSYIGYDLTPFVYKMSPDPTTAEGIISTQVSEQIKKDFHKVIMAKSESEAVSTFNQMIDNLDKLGLEKLEAFWSNQYKKNVEKFSE